MASATPKEIPIRGESIELAQVLMFAGVGDPGGAAKQVIAAGQVKLNGVVETRRGRSVVPGDEVAYAGATLVVRAGR
jgi:ribosome-associated protein